MFRQSLKCSFCGRDQVEVAKLVSGRRAYICDECVAAAQRILDGDDTIGPRRAHGRSATFPGNLVAFIRRFIHSVDRELASGQSGVAAT